MAVVSPIDGLGEEYLFSAHMVQHILLGDLAPLLLLLSLSRVIMRPATRRFHAIERKLGRFAHPATFIVAWLALVYFWHIPAIYNGALENPFLHGLEHATFFTAGTLLWWPLIQPVPMRHRLDGHAGAALRLRGEGDAGRARALPDLVDVGRVRLLRGRAAHLGPDRGRPTRTSAARS